MAVGEKMVVFRGRGKNFSEVVAVQLGGGRAEGQEALSQISPPFIAPPIQM